MPRLVLIQPRRFEPRKMILPGLVVGGLILVALFRAPPRDGASASPLLALAGETMGTTFHIQVVAPAQTAADETRLVEALQKKLEEVNCAMSTYDPDSEISRFNRAPAGTDVAVSDGFAAVLRFALELAERSGGVFDPTVGPLVNLWGFGPDGRRTAPPTAEAIAAARARVGWRHVTLRTDAEGRPVLHKAIDGLLLDLSAVAKGYGVDAVGAAIRTLGYDRFFVEIGGEILVAGRNAHDRPWRIGVDQPRLDAEEGKNLQAILHLRGGAVATSGDYRNYFRGADGALYAHIVDPRTGQSVSHPQSSVTVLADDCMTADGLATALFVLGPEEGLAWLASAYPAADALVVVRDPATGAWIEKSTPGWAARSAMTRPR